MKGINVEYSLNPEYFKVGCAYQIHVSTNDFRIGILTTYSKDSVTFKILDKEGNMIDLTFTIGQLRYFDDLDLIKMKPDYESGKFSAK